MILDNNAAMRELVRPKRH